MMTLSSLLLEQISGNKATPSSLAIWLDVRTTNLAKECPRKVKKPSQRVTRKI
jgi:hypothetical protein